MTIESILGLAVPIIGGIAEIAKNNSPKVIERVEAKEIPTQVPEQQTSLVKPFAQIDRPQQPINVNFNLNIFINGKKPGDKSETDGNRIIIDA